ncbi:MAG: response regulator transcription factor [Sphingobacteriales bacterium]|nr:MAG: response regulator transcription factor [Sphingobacteriales bacterium]
MTAQRILIVEDEVKVALSLKEGLEEKGFSVDLAYDGYIGQRMAASHTYDLVILDVNLPSVNGYAVCDEIRRSNNSVPVLMLTAMGTTEDKLTGFNSGADDYLVKPFEFRELLARINALTKRSGRSAQGNNNNLLKIADLELDVDTKIVRRAGKRIQLTSKEYYLLEYLLRNKGRVLSRSDIAEKIWDITFETGTNVIDVYINFLRRKIDKDYTPKLIHTQKGMGYVLAEDIGQ